MVATRAVASGGEEKAGEVVAAVTSAADDVAPAATKKSGRSRYERRSSPHYNAAKSNREKEKVEKVEKDHKEKGEGGGGGGGGSGIKVEKDHKEKEDKKKAVVEEKVEEESGKIAGLLKPGKKRERSVRQKRLSERADHVAATNKGGNSD